jgi:hypothetical protein
MKKIVGIGVTVCAILSITMFSEPAVQAWNGDGAYAQSSACYQNCRNVRKWPPEQCRRFCKGRS